MVSSYGLPAWVSSELGPMGGTTFTTSAAALEPGHYYVTRDPMTRERHWPGDCSRAVEVRGKAASYPGPRSSGGARGQNDIFRNSAVVETANADTCSIKDQSINQMIKTTKNSPTGCHQGRLGVISYSGCDYDVNLRIWGWLNFAHAQWKLNQKTHSLSRIVRFSTASRSVGFLRMRVAVASSNCQYRKISSILLQYVELCECKLADNTRFRTGVRLQSLANCIVSRCKF